MKIVNLFRWRSTIAYFDLSNAIVNRVVSASRLLVALLFSSTVGASAQVFDNIVVDGKTSVYAFDGKFGGNGGLPAVSLDLTMCRDRELAINKAFGKIGCCGIINNGPDGRRLNTMFDANAMNGISGWHATRGLALVGLFLQPNVTLESTPPKHIDYREISFDSVRYQPKSRQVFFIGDGYSQKFAKPQIFNVPDEASRLILGIIDRTPDGKPGHYYDNVGAFQIDLVVSGCPALVS